MMKRRILIIVGILVAAALMVSALQIWQNAPHNAIDADRPDMVLYAGRMTAVAVGTLAQSILILMVLGNIYRTRTSDIILRLLAVVLFTVSLISAIALSLAARS
jgi:hypothetical protein